MAFRRSWVLAFVIGCGGGESGGGESEAEAEGGGEDGGAKTCDDDSDCPGGEACVGGECRGADDGGGPAPHLTLSKKDLDFGAPLIGSETTLDLLVLSDGKADLTVSAVVLTEDDEVEEYEALPSGSVDLTIPPGEAELIEVTLRPIDAEADLGTITIFSNDPANPSADVTLTSEVKGEVLLGACVLTGDEPDLDPDAPCADPEEISFDGIPYGDTESRLVRITNLGTDNRPMDLQDVSLAGDSGAEDLFDIELFRFVDDDEDVVYLPEYVNPGGDDAVFARVTFTADVSGYVPAEIVRIESDDENDPEHDIPVTGVVDGCPDGFIDANDDPADGCEYACEFTGAEVCDGADNDCDGDVDTGCNVDGDGYCTDDMVVIGAPATCLGGGGDCNDAAPAVYPGALELCDGLDNDCDVGVDEGGNGCGGACTLAGVPGGPCDGADSDLCTEGTYACSGWNALSCTDATGDNAEVCNTLDDDCDALIDEGTNACGGACTLTSTPGSGCDGADADACIEGIVLCAGLNATTCGDTTGDNAEVCNTIDDDCDSLIDEGSNPCGGACALGGTPGAACDGADADLCAEGLFACAGPNSVTCGDATGDTAEVCNTVDDDCDTIVDEGTNACGGACTLSAAPGTPCDGADADGCAEGLWTCAGLNSVACSDATGDNVEVCNTLDDDCDSLFDEGGNPCGGVCALPGVPGAGCDGPDSDLCAEGAYACSGWNALSCSDATGDTLEVCNGFDDDCDLVADDGIPPGAACDGGDADLCTEGNLVCSGGSTVCSDTTGDSIEICNGIDDDCDLSTDEGIPPGAPCDGADADLCEEGDMVCSGGSMVCGDATGDTAEVCGNSIDDDCDTLIDEGCAAGCWTGTTFDTTGDMQGASIARDTSGGLHVAYVDVTANTLRYATCTSGCDSAAGWTAVTVTSTGAPRDPSIGWDPVGGGRVHISYRASSTNDLSYAICTGSCTVAASWSSTAVEASNDCGYNSSLFVDGFGTVHVSYYDLTSTNLNYARCSGSCNAAASWTLVDLGGGASGWAGMYSAVTADSGGILHIAYSDDSWAYLRYARCTSSCGAAGSWVHYNVDTSGYYPLGVAIVADGVGVHVGYTRSDVSLRYGLCAGTCPTGVWSILPVDTIGNVGLDPAIATDSSGVVYVVYDDQQNSTLRYARCGATCTSAANWSTTTVLDGNAARGSAVVDGSGNLHVAYQVRSTSASYGLAYGRQGTALTCITCGMSRVGVDTASASGGDSQIVVDASGAYHVVHRDTSLNYLRYSTCSSSCDSAASWTTITVDSFSAVGQGIDLVRDGSGVLHASYVNTSTADLKYARCASGCTSPAAWTYVAVDTAATVGSNGTGIAVDGSGVASIAYYDSTPQNVKYARCASGCDSAASWSLGTITSPGTGGNYASLAVTSTGVLHLAYNAISTSPSPGLTYMTCSSGASCTAAVNWTSAVVDAGSANGNYNALVRDGSGVLHVAYYNSGTADLKYARCSSTCTTAANWTAGTVDSSGSVGSYADLAVDSGGVAHVSYYDGSYGDLRYARCAGSCTNTYSWTRRTIDSQSTVGSFTGVAVEPLGGAAFSSQYTTSNDLRWGRLDTAAECAP